MKILIYTTIENYDFWISVVTKDKKVSMCKSYGWTRIYDTDNRTIYYVLLKITENLRGHRWNEVILDAPISEELYYNVIYFKAKEIIKTKNYKIIK